MSTYKHTSGKTTIRLPSFKAPEKSEPEYETDSEEAVTSGEEEEDDIEEGVDEGVDDESLAIRPPRKQQGKEAPHGVTPPSSPFAKRRDKTPSDVANVKTKLKEVIERYSNVDLDLTSHMADKQKHAQLKSVNRFIRTLHKTLLKNPVGAVEALVEVRNEIEPTGKRNHILRGILDSIELTIHKEARQIEYFMERLKISTEGKAGEKESREEESAEGEYKKSGLGRFGGAFLGAGLGSIVGMYALGSLMYPRVVYGGPYYPYVAGVYPTVL